MKTQTCRSHCRACGFHFAGDTAFEKHRAGTFEPPDRYCIEPSEDSRFEPVQGICRISDPDLSKPCSVWRLAGVGVRIEAAFGNSRRSANTFRSEDLAA